MNRSSLHVTVVSRSDSEGGADRAAYRLHQAFSQSEQIVSKMVVHYSNTADPTVITGEVTKRKRKEISIMKKKLITILSISSSYQM